MASLTIRNLDDSLKKRLCVRAAEHGKSMEEEAREILRSVLSQEDTSSAGLARAIRRRFAEFDGVDLQIPDREAQHRPELRQ